MIAGTTVPALAQEDRRQEAQDHRQDVLQNVQERREDRVERLSGRHAERLLAFWNRTIRRVQHLLDRLTGIADGVAQRLNRFEEAGKDVTEQRAALATVYRAIASAQEVLDGSTEEVKAIIDQHEPREAFRLIREKHRELMGEVRHVHRALVDAIKSIRGLSDVEHDDSDGGDDEE